MAENQGYFDVMTDALEPAARSIIDQRGTDRAVEFSIAVSLKRIADALEELARTYAVRL